MNVLDILLERTLETPESLFWLIMIGAIRAEAMAAEIGDTDAEFRARLVQRKIEEIDKEISRNEQNSF